MADVSFGLLLPTGCESEFTGCCGPAAWRMLERLAVAGESAGFESLWVGDHLLGVRPDGGGGGPVLEAWTVLAALASVTRRCRVGVFVFNVSFRAPALLARMAATVGAVAGSGRLQLGVGAGWYEAEHEALGFRFGAPADRVARLERHIGAVREAWSALAGTPGRGGPGRRGSGRCAVPAVVGRRRG